jgi:hypothetical protein
MSYPKALDRNPRITLKTTEVRNPPNSFLFSPPKYVSIQKNSWLLVIKLFSHNAKMNAICLSVSIRTGTGGLGQDKMMEELLSKVEELEDMLLQKDDDLRLAAEIGQQLVMQSQVRVIFKFD